MSRLQAMYEKSANHLLNQNRRSLQLTDCAYFQFVEVDGEPDVLQCAAGIFLWFDAMKQDKDEFEYCNTMAFQDILDTKPYLLLPEYQNLDENEIELIRGLQFIHDKNPPRSWLPRLEALGHAMGLDTMFLKQRYED